MICAAGRIESDIVPVPEIAIAVRWCLISHTIGGGVSDRTCEASIVELLPEYFREYSALVVRRNFVIASFIIIVANKEGLYRI